MNCDIIIIYLYIFFTGCCFGSFFNLCIDRIPKAQSIAKPRSHCTNCGKTLGILELVPVLSYIFLGGKCRHCGVRLSPRYVSMEIIWGFIFLLSFIKYLLTLNTILSIIVLSYLLISGMIEYDNAKKSILSYGVSLLMFIYMNIWIALGIVAASIATVYFLNKLRYIKINFMLIMFVLVFGMLIF